MFEFTWFDVAVMIASGSTGLCVGVVATLVTITLAAIRAANVEQRKKEDVMLDELMKGPFGKTEAVRGLSGREETES